jgi:hypothetical protein
MAREIVKSGTVPAIVPEAGEKAKAPETVMASEASATGAGNRIRTGDLLLGKEMLYH